MKPAATLKEILKPPFFSCGDLSLDWMIECGYLGSESNQHFLCTVYGRRFLGYENCEQLQKELREFVEQALNEKWERDFTGPPRWQRELTCQGKPSKFSSCPKCTYITDKVTNYCPSCGRRLLPPKEE